MEPLLKYFAYGSNLHPLRLRERVPSAAVLEVAVLAGWQLRFHKRGQDRSGKCNVISTGRSDDRVIGVVYAMAAAERHRLDAAEGLGKGYTEARLAVGAAGAVHEVFLYLAQPAYIHDALRPFAWYRQLVAEGARFHRLPDAYLEQILAVETLEDPDPHRAARHAELLDRLTRGGTGVL